MPIMLTAEASVLDAGVLDFIIDAVTKVIGVLTTPPLGTFLTIGILGSVVGLTAGIVSVVRNKKG